MIPYGRQDVTDDDLAAVRAVLESDYLTQGPTVPAFETAVADRVRAQHAVAANSATAALHLACMALDLGPGDLLWTVPNTFVASANCARYCGADVDFVDIDRDTWNLSTAALREKLSDAKRRGRLPKIVIPVHFSGQPTDQEEIWALAAEYGFKVVEDASHAIGASRHGEPVGSCRFSDVTVFSFHPVKIITTCEGGMALTNDAALAGRMQRLRSHGITRDPARFEARSPGPWYHEQHELGYNYRLTDVHAALGLSQLRRLERYVSERNRLADRYQAAFAGAPLRRPTIRDGNVSAFHLYVVRIDAQRVGHEAAFVALRDAGIAVNLHYFPVHLQPYYRRLGFAPGLCPEAETYAREAITLPLYPTMTESQQDQVIAAVRAVVGCGR